MTGSKTETGFWAQVDEFSIDAADTFDGLADVQIMVHEMEFDFNFCAAEFRFLAAMFNDMAQRLEKEHK